MKALFAGTALYRSSRILPESSAPAVSPSPFLPWRSRWAEQHKQTRHNAKTFTRTKVTRRYESLHSRRGEILIAAAVCFILCGRAPNALADSPTDASTTQASIQVMELTTERAYLGARRNSGSEYYVVDISRPETPRFIDQAELGATVTALQPTLQGTFLGTATPRRDLFLHIAGSESAEKVLTLPGLGKIRNIQIVAGSLLIQCDADEGQDNTFIVDIAEPRKPQIRHQAETPALRLPRQLRMPPQIANIPPTNVSRIWQHHPGNPEFAAIGLDTDHNSFRLHRIQPESLRFKDNNKNGQLELACVGDSNTFAGSHAWPPSWCRRVGKEILNPDFSTRNYSVLAAALHIGWTEKSAHTLLDNALRDKPDAVLFALGTNDLPTIRPNHMATDIQHRIDILRKLTARAESTGAQVFVALLPPRYDAQDPPGSRELFNQAIRDNWRDEEITDFDSGFSPSDFGPDGLHFNGPGHAKRTVRVAEFLLGGRIRGVD